MGILGDIVSKKRVQIIQNNNTVVQLDASIKEEHKKDSTPTDFPIEDGRSISDHIILKPQELTLTGIISDTPLSGQLTTEVTNTLASALLPPVAFAAASIGTALRSALMNSSSPSVAAYGQLLQLQANALPVDVYTSLYRYSDMWITSISAPRDSGTGKALMFTVSFKQLLIVAPQTVNVSIFANPGLAANKADVGEQDALRSRLQEGRLQGIKDTLGNGG